MATIWIQSNFQDNGVPALGLTPLITIYRLDTDAVVVNAANMAAVANGIYKYSFGTYTYTLDYAIYVDGGAALDNIDRYQYSSNQNEPWNMATRTLTALGFQLNTADFVAAFLTAALIATDAIGAAELATSAVNEIRDAILADSVAFNGADIAAILADTAAIEPLVTAFVDAAISTRATPANIAAAHAVTDALIAALNDPTVAQIVAGIFGRVVEGALTFEEFERIKFAVLAGLSAGGGSASNRFRDLANTKDRVRATVDASGNRQSIIIDGTP